MRYLLLSIALLVLSASEKLTAQSGINVYGLSFHFDRKDVTERSFNEINLGLGVNYVVCNNEKSILFVDAGFYKDSYSRVAGLIGGGMRYKVALRLSLGMALFLLSTPSINDGKPIVAPLPLLSYTQDFVTVSATYLPKYKNMNRYHAIAGYLTFHLWRK